MTNLPPGSPIGPVFNVIVTPAGVASPPQTTLANLLSPLGAIITVPDNTTSITVESTGLCTNESVVEVPCTNPFEFLLRSFFQSTQNPTPNLLKDYVTTPLIINGCNVCEKECNPYLFGGTQTAVDYYTTNPTLDCCTKVIANIENYIAYLQGSALDTNTKLAVKFSVLNAGVLSTVVLLEQPTLHNGKPWFCFDEPGCQKVIYWSIGGLFPNQWVYSLNGLDGTNIVSWLNLNSSYPISISGWGTLAGPNGVSSSFLEYIYQLPTSPSCIDSNFIECFTDLTTYFSPLEINTLLDYGIVESGSIQQESILCKLKDIFLSIDPNFTTTEVLSYIIAMLEVGIVVFTDPVLCDGIITTYSTYIKYAEAVGGGGIP